MTEPGTASYDELTRYMVEELMKDVAELRKRIDGPLWLAARTAKTSSSFASPCH